MSIIKKPIITEKYSGMGETLNKYGFVVDRKATKEQIKEEVEKLFEVEVVSINTMVYAGKTKFRYTRRNITTGKTSSFKKAVVTLKDGDSIDFFSNI